MGFYSSIFLTLAGTPRAAASVSAPSLDKATLKQSVVLRQLRRVLWLLMTKG